MLDCQKNLFSLAPNIHYLNNAAYGPLPIKSAEAAQIGINSKLNPQFKTPASHFEYPNRLKVLISEVINAQNSERIAVIPAVSYGMAIVAANLHRLPQISEKHSILTIENEFPNTTYAFERSLKSLNLEQIEVVKPSDLSIGKIWNENILNAISKETAMVVVPHVHWIHGIVFDLVAIGKRCREVGALLIVDGTQSVGAMPFDIQSIQPDALICGAYKWLLGPYSLGFAYFGEFFDDGVPLEESWMHRVESDNFANLTNLKRAYRPFAQRYNMGEHSQFILAPILEESLKLILKLGVKNIQQYARNLSKAPIQKLGNLGCLVEHENYRAGHLFGLSLPTAISREKLTLELEKRKVFVSKRGAGLRISANVFNTPTDFDVLLESLENAKKS